MNEKLLKILETQAELLNAVLKEGDGDLKTKTPANASNYTPLHGSGGILTAPGLEREIITAHVRPFGIASDLPLLPSVYQDPRFGAITGFTDVVGSQPTYACQDAPYGYVKACNLSARFGRIRFDTNTIDMDDVMLKLHRGDHTDLMLAGRLLGLTDLVPSNISEEQFLNIVTMAEMVGVGVQTEREITRQIWQGTWGVANQFPGLDVQIATGQKDADTGVLCPALDSDVKSFGYADVGGTTRDIVEYLSMLAYYLDWNAKSMGLDPVQWIVVMRPQLWHELSAVWPCRYNTTRCSVIDTAGVDTVPSIDAADMTRLRDDMRTGNYIYINGIRYPVRTDVGIYEHNSTNNANLNAGEYASSIYIIPLTIRGGMPVCYREYVDYRAAQRDVNLLNGTQPFFWTDNGVYSWALEYTKWCYKLSLKTEQRVVLRTPQLAGRIDYVKYTPLQHVREADPKSPYFVDGGVSLRGGLSAPYAVWS